MSDAPGQPRLSARALIVFNRRLLLVNATPDKDDGMWCTPGGGVDAGFDLRENIRREVLEETGLEAKVGDLIAVSEFFDRAKNFHQVDLFFGAIVEHDRFPQAWRDVADVVERKGFFTSAEIADMNVFPRFLCDGFWLAMSDKAVIYRGYEEKL